jgi:uncharacterized membrane protein YhaH (DUF805 family)
MDFMTAVRTCLSKYVDFSGRARRSEYWYFALFNFLVGIVANILDSILGTGYEGATGGGLINTVVGLALFLPGLAVAVRRLHDTGRSGWWVLLVFAIIVGWIVLLVWFVSDSKADNQYGPNPKGAAPGGYPPPPPPAYGTGQYNG